MKLNIPCESFVSIFDVALGQRLPEEFEVEPKWPFFAYLVNVLKLMSKDVIGNIDDVSGKHHFGPDHDAIDVELLHPWHVVPYLNVVKVFD